jgi:sulfite exporter TauE/SafE
MVNFVLAFVTGLTTGGLSCLAVQGGLLASSLANQIEKDLQVAGQNKAQHDKKKTAKSGQAQRVLAQNTPQVALPILAFLGAKLLAYTLLGFLLGWVGSMFQLSPISRAFLQIAIGIFMVGSALRMLNVHPMFRFFVFEPPAFLRRRIRKTASSSTSFAAPVFLGFLTVLIPCGITQAMMAVALSSANPIDGAVTMFAFTLGASPVFFAVAYFATRLGARLEKHFVRFVAVLLLILGVYSIDTGVNLAGSPVSLTRFVNSVWAQPAQAASGRPLNGLTEFNPNPAGPNLPETGAVSGGEQDEDVITIKVLNTGYEPNVIRAKAGVPVKMKLVSKNVYSCSLAFVIPAIGYQANLKPTGEAWVEIPAQKPGTKMPFSCSMGMFTGDIFFD